jgi:hypothetical protein
LVVPEETLALVVVEEMLASVMQRLVLVERPEEQLVVLGSGKPTVWGHW